MKYRRVNVEVDAHFDTLGRLLPLSMTWEDGTVFEIDRVVEAKKAASMKAGGIGTRFTVKIKGQERYLYFENPQWFVEVPVT